MNGLSFIQIILLKIGAETFFPLVSHPPPAFVAGSSFVSSRGGLFEESALTKYSTSILS